MKLRNPVTLSRLFKLKPSQLRKLGVFDANLNVDTPLFIDPLLLAGSQHAEMQQASRSFNAHFAEVVHILRASRKPNDIAWREARRRLSFPEVSGTCLGYSAGSTGGSGFGPQLSENLLNTAKDIIDMGIDDPMMFVALPLFEENIGSDRISDMTTNIIIGDLLNFNKRVLISLDIPTQPFNVQGIPARLPANSENNGRYIILVPTDVLRDLPIVLGFSDIASCAAHNQELREQVNKTIGNIWGKKTAEQKRDIKRLIRTNPDAFSTLLAMIRNVPSEPYDQDIDAKGLTTWASYARSSMEQWPMDLSQLANRPLTSEDVKVAVSKIVEQFRHLVEDKGLWKLLWANKTPRPEKSAQLLFFAIADSYCKINNLDLTTEADSGNGPVDFKLSSGYDKRILVEIKLSKNTKVVHGYENQIERYKLGEDTEHAIYLVISLSPDWDKTQAFAEARNRLIEAGRTPSTLIFVDGSIRKSASLA
jgi:hypothetical protein